MDSIIALTLILSLAAFSTSNSRKEEAEKTESSYDQNRLGSSAVFYRRLGIFSIFLTLALAIYEYI